MRNAIEALGQCPESPDVECLQALHVDGEPVRGGYRREALHPPCVEHHRLDGSARRARLVEQRSVDRVGLREMVPDDVADPSSELVLQTC